jgi:hypothetical protein
MEESLQIHHSEQIHWASYDPDTQQLNLTLNDRRKHGYSPVPQKVVNGFVRAKSHGDFFHKNIRNNPNYRYHGKVE